ncbi:MAG: helix-turn-helix domain-containing protein [Pseudonocardiaceae bacterium]
MRDRNPTVRSRELGEGLRRALQEAGLNGQEAARLLGCSQSWISRLLSGKRGASEQNVAALLGLCRVKPAERDRLLALCREQYTPGWLQQHGSRLPKQLVTLINHENRAVAIESFQAMVVPGLLQTGEYARAVISRCANVPADEVEERVAARLARRSLFSREYPPRFTFYVHEFVLRTPVGGSAVMREQLDHLLHRSRRPSLTLRVVPASLGAHAATAGSFTFLEFAEFPPVTYLESATSSLFLERPEETAAHRSILAALAATALGEEESRELIATLATELYPDWEDHHDRA